MITPAANLFDNPLVILGFLLFAALSSWISQRRGQAGGDASRPQPGGAPPIPGEQERPAGELDLQEALRRLLGGESTQQSPPPLLGRGPRPRQSSPVELDDEPFHSERDWMEEAQETYDERPSVKQPLESSRQHTAAVPPVVPPVWATRVETGAVQPGHRFGSFKVPERHPAVAVSQGRRHSNTGVLWRDRRALRRAFIASLVFGPPKGLET